MLEKTYKTKSGTIHYWMSMIDPAALTLVFLPGLTADHRLFDKQIAYFEQKYNVFVWDAPGHAASWPFAFDFTLMDKAKWLGDILEQEWIKDAGHNANTDQPEIVNQLIEDFCLNLL